MKLISVKIIGKNFRSLSANKLYSYNYTFESEKLSTKIFAGLNGSGKSNFLELFSEIFYFLELCQLDTVSNNEKATKNFGFEIQYYLPISKIDFEKLFETEINDSVESYIKDNLHLTQNNREEFIKIHYNEIDEFEKFVWNQLSSLLRDNHIHVRISKRLGEKPEYSIQTNDEYKIYRLIENNKESILPKKIIAYTSGQNELLSNPFYKLKYHYFKIFENKKKIEDGDQLADNHRMFFLDYSNNFSIFIANMLLADDLKISYLKEILEINDLQSFRITLNTNELYKKVILKNRRITVNLLKLKQCATTWVEKNVEEHNLLILDFFVNRATKDAFKFHFGSAFNLFSFFYELEIFNLYQVDENTRNSMLQVHKSYNVNDESSKPDPSRLTFRIEKIIISKNLGKDKPPAEIYYKALSDGEHQFIEVLGTVLMMEQPGCLFLLDEPDTHFNPKWRAKLIQLLNYMAATSFDSEGNVEKVRSQEIILTTHSPFVISDSNKEDVYKFDKINGEVRYISPKIETYGASMSLLLQEIFDRKISISDLSNTELEKLRTEIKELKSNDAIKEKIEETKEKLLDFGESIEKFDMYSFLRHIEKEIESK